VRRFIAALLLLPNCNLSGVRIWIPIWAEFQPKVKDIDQSNFAGEIARISDNVMYSSWFKED
jgi:hypothetical protein